MIENGPGWVRITHPDIDGTAEVTQASFDEPTGGGYKSYEDRGWSIVERYQDPSAPVETSPLLKLSKDELVARATDRGVDPSGTKNDIVAALAAAGDNGEDI